MTWYELIMIGMFLGFCVSFFSVTGATMLIMRRPALMQRFSRRMMHAMMSGATPKKKEVSKRETRDDKHASTGPNVGTPLLAFLPDRYRPAIPRTRANSSVHEYG